MEKEEEKIEQIHRKRRRQSSSSSLPLDLISEIFLKLPVKSVVRFRCVSKLWSSIATDPYFTHKFNTRSPKRPSHLLSFKRKDKLFVFSIRHDHHQSSTPVDSYHITYPKHWHFSSKNSVQGLICFPNQSKPMIWNPTMRQFKTLPKPEKSWKDITCFLGYDPIQGKHKVLCFPFDKTIDECRVYTLGLAQESWRKIKTNHKHRPFVGRRYECMDGVLYYEAADIDNVGIIMSFDVRSEKFHIIKLPWNNIYGCSVLTPYKGRLGCVNFGREITLWILEDAEKHHWLRPVLCSAPCNYYNRKLATTFYFGGITDAGEFFYVPSKFLKTFYILYYDPKTKRFRRPVESKCIVDDKFKRKHGLMKKRLPRIHRVVNHIESLMSL